MPEDLVQKDLPYGERQERVDQMQQSGLPLTSHSGAGGGAVSPSPSPQTALPPDFDALGEVQPSPSVAGPVLTSEDRLMQVAESTPNSFLAAMIRRVLANDS